jgi:hypothetical protein
MSSRNNPKEMEVYCTSGSPNALVVSNSFTHHKPRIQMRRMLDGLAQNSVETLDERGRIFKWHSLEQQGLIEE